LALDQNIRLDVDGEPIYNSRFRFDVLPRRLKVLLPPGASLSWQ